MRAQAVGCTLEVVEQLSARAKELVEEKVRRAHSLRPGVSDVHAAGAPGANAARAGGGDFDAVGPAGRAGRRAAALLRRQLWLGSRCHRGGKQRSTAPREGC